MNAAVPSPWPALLLALAAYRVTRLVGWDVFPPIAKARAWVIGEKIVSAGTVSARLGLTGETPDYQYVYRWPLLAELVGCAFCLGAWISLAIYLLWLKWPVPTMYASVPLALSGFVGLVAKQLDP